MLEAMSAAAGAVATIAPFLTELGKGAANKFGGAAAERLVGWLRGKTSGRAYEALTDLERDPASEDNQADLRKQLAKLLQDDPALLAEIAPLLSDAKPAVDTMTQQVGAGGKASQIKGDQNQVSIG